jgi:streptogramin lyase
LIRKISPAGVVTTLAGTGSTGAVNGNGTSASFNYPYGVAVDGSGNVYVADTVNHLIRKISPSGVVTTLAGTVGNSGAVNANGTSASFYFPFGVAVDGSGNVYVADQGNHLIRKISPSGDVTTLAGDAGSTGAVNGNGTLASFNSPAGVAVDGSGNVYVADRNNHLIRRVLG